MQTALWRRVFYSLMLLAGLFSGTVQAQTSSGSAAAGSGTPGASANQPAAVTPMEAATEVDIGEQSIFGRALQGGLIVFSCLLLLICFSIVTWAVVIGKFVFLQKLQSASDAFIKSFWDSRSLNDLNSKLGDYPYSPVREVFRSGYAELVRGSQLRETAITSEIAISAALDNLNRALGKAKAHEKRRMEKFMSLLAIVASASPFVGLFGTVWGIMGAFEGIARTGSASLAAVAPGISEALIATAFGLAAAIPAVIGYNMFAARVRNLSGNIDGFIADFLNIVERYLVSDRSKSAGAATAGSGTGASPGL
jgi:biopolymer transport protein TolQ